MLILPYSTSRATNKATTPSPSSTQSCIPKGQHRRKTPTNRILPAKRPNRHIIQTRTSPPALARSTCRATSPRTCTPASASLCREMVVSSRATSFRRRNRRTIPTQLGQEAWICRSVEKGSRGKRSADLPSASKMQPAMAEEEARKKE